MAWWIVVFDAASFDTNSFDEGSFLFDGDEPTTITDIRLSKSSVKVTAGVNAIVGALSSIGGDSPYSYSLAAGTGDTNNADFSISSNVLRCDNPATLGVGTYSVRIQSTDGNSTFAKPFTITVYQPSSGGSGFGRLIKALIRYLIG